MSTVNRKWLSMLLAYIIVIASLIPYQSQVAEAAETTDVQPPFSWDNASVYFTMTDRFKDGNSSNNSSYGRVQTDATGKNIGTFQGGDIKGLTQKLQDGYFTDLGINAIWITAPYEQIHGWVGGGSGGDFAHYSYHGYYALDYTEMDKNMGTVEEMREFVDLAHSQGIRIVMDVVMNHAGYATLKDMEQYNFGARTINSSWTPSSGQTWHTYNDFVDFTNSTAWAGWWGNWVRAGIGGYTACGGDEKTQCLSGLPDFKTELTSSIGAANILSTKWAQETTGFTNWIVPAAANLRQNLNLSPADSISKWLAAWVQEFGIDGFRVDTAKHVDMSVWSKLKSDANTALTTWRQNNPTKPGANWTDNFWMTAEVWGHGVGKSAYFSNGFDSVINFAFQDSNMSSLEGTYSSYAAAINSDPTFNVLSYISSHDTKLYNRSNLLQAGTALMLLPGGVQIFYGDETARPFGDTGSDPYQGTRSFMNWSSINTTVLSHWQKLGQFRNNHLSVGAGSHAQIAASPYTFSRTYNKNGIQDSVVVVTGATGTVQVNVSSVFDDGATVRDAYTGNSVIVSDGKAVFTAHANGVILIEQTAPSKLPSVSISPSSGTFKTETLALTLAVSKASSGKYTLDGSDPQLGTTYTSGTQLTIGQDMAFNESKTIKLFAENEFGTSVRTYTFTKKDPNAPLTIHFKKPDSWGAPQLYFYETSPVIAEPLWAASPAMTSEGGSWYKYTFTGLDSVRVIFKDSSGHQTPGVNAAGILISQESWYSDQLYDHNPEVADTVAPTVPTALSSTAHTDTTVSLAWTASTDNVGVAGYQIWKDGIQTGTSTTPSYTATGLTALTAYSFTVKAYDAAGNVSEASVPVSVTTAEPSPGNTVTIYYKQGYTTPYIHYKLNGVWTALPGVAIPAAEITGYNKISINIGTAIQLEVAFNNGSGTWDSRGGLNYIFPAGTSTFSAGTITSGAPDSQAPTAPTALQSTGKTSSTVTLSWTASTDNVAVTAYDIYQGSTKLGSTTGTVYTYTATGLSSNTSYTFTVKARDGAGNVSEASSPLTVKTENGNKATIYYKRGYSTPYIHYQPIGGAWTTSPGVAMPASDIAGYNVITIDLGTATGLNVAFNNGSGTWDNKGGQNYQFPVGTSTFVAGTITAGLPQADSLTFNVTVPAGTADSDVYLTSTLNSWAPADANYKLTKNTDGTYSIKIDAASGTTIQYKFTKGAWTNVEVASSGVDIANRSITPTGGAQVVAITIARWKS